MSKKTKNKRKADAQRGQRHIRNGHQQRHRKGRPNPVPRRVNVRDCKVVPSLGGMAPEHVSVTACWTDEDLAWGNPLCHMTEPTIFPVKPDNAKRMIP